MNYFREVYDRTMGHEGMYCNDPHEKETYMGICRAYWPDWLGWHLIVQARNNKTPLDSKRSGLLELVESFYKTNFWTRIQGNKLAAISSEAGYEVFDTAVNVGVPDAVRFLQTALNMQRTYCRSYSELLVDGLLGPVTLMALGRYLAIQPGDRDNFTGLHEWRTIYSLQG